MNKELRRLQALASHTSHATDAFIQYKLEYFVRRLKYSFKRMVVYMQIILYFFLFWKFAGISKFTAREEIFVFCTHLDHHGMQRAALPFGPGLQIQAAQAEILTEQANEFCSGADTPRVILGDFNSWPGAGAHPVLLQHGYHEASTSAQATFVGFRSGSFLSRFQNWLSSVQIDYIFRTKDLALEGYHVHHNVYSGCDGRSRNLSDHCMIMAYITPKEV